MAAEIQQSGGVAIPIKCDLRDEQQVKAAIEQAVSSLGSLELLVNNASAISLTSCEATDAKKFDLMHQVNVRGTFILCKYAIPHLKRSGGGQIVNISPPLCMQPKWFSGHTAYTTSKYGMSMVAIGLAAELRPFGIRVDCLWPKTLIATSALRMLGSPDTAKLAGAGRIPEIVADALVVLASGAYKATALQQERLCNFYIDEEVLREQHGWNDFARYSVTPGQKELQLDFFLPEYEQVEAWIKEVPHGTQLVVQDLYGHEAAWYQGKRLLRRMENVSTLEKSFSPKCCKIKSAL